MMKMRRFILAEFKLSGLSMRQLAIRSGVPYQAVWHLVKGVRDPALSTVEKISKVLGLDLRRKDGN